MLIHYMWGVREREMSRVIPVFVNNSLARCEHKDRNLGGGRKEIGGGCGYFETVNDDVEKTAGYKSQELREVWILI